MLGRTNTGGGGVGGVLTVTAPAGVTVSVSKDGKVKTKTANAEGLAVFKGLKTGTWQLTITDGEQTSTKPVVITADYNTTIAFFAATISITYPAGSTCTCSDGVTTLTAPDTSGTWECVVSNTGTWTIGCTNGSDTANEVVEITTDGQSESVALAYWDGSSLYIEGDEIEGITGGWSYATTGSGSYVKNSDSITLKNGQTGSGGGASAYTNKKIRIPANAVLNITVSNAHEIGTCLIGLGDDQTTMVSSKSISTGTASLQCPETDGEYYIIISIDATVTTWAGYMTFTKVWLS